MTFATVSSTRSSFRASHLVYPKSQAYFFCCQVIKVESEPQPSQPNPVRSRNHSFDILRRAVDQAATPRSESSSFHIASESTSATLSLAFIILILRFKQRKESSLRSRRALLSTKSKPSCPVILFLAFYLQVIRTMTVFLFNGHFYVWRTFVGAESVAVANDLTTTRNLKFPSFKLCCWQDLVALFWRICACLTS